MALELRLDATSSFLSILIVLFYCITFELTLYCPSLKWPGLLRCINRREDCVNGSHFTESTGERKDAWTYRANQKYTNVWKNYLFYDFISKWR